MENRRYRGALALALFVLSDGLMSGLAHAQDSIQPALRNIVDDNGVDVIRMPSTRLTRSSYAIA